jgi:hypothetical protein
MEWPEQPPEPERARAAFNMVALYLAGYTYDQIELFHPADMTPDRLNELLMKKSSELLVKWFKKRHVKVVKLREEVEPSRRIP